MTSIEEGFRSYFASFNTLDINAVIGHYEPPCVFVTSQFSIAISDAEQLRSVLSAQFDQMRAEGWKRSEVSDLQAHELGSDLALVTCEVMRFDTADEELNRFRAAYTLRRRDRWLVAAVAVGNPSKGEWTA